MLRTKAMREREEQRERRKYKFTLIRVRFPDGLVLQVKHCYLDNEYVFMWKIEFFREPFLSMRSTAR